MQGALGEAGEGAKSQITRSCVCRVEEAGLRTVPNVSNLGHRWTLAPVSPLKLSDKSRGCVGLCTFLSRGP